MRTYRYIPLYYFYWSVYNYEAHDADIWTPTTVVQGVDNHSCGLYCRRCNCIRFCWVRSSRIFHFSRWFGQLSTDLTKDESPHTRYTFTTWVVYFTPPSIEHKVGGTSILRLIQMTKILWTYWSVIIQYLNALLLSFRTHNCDSMPVRFNHPLWSKLTEHRYTFCILLPNSPISTCNS